MAIVKVYNRDGTEYGTLDTNQYIFNNNLIGFEPTNLDSSIYPYVKVNGIYYVNDGGEFFSKGRADNSAGLMSVATTYLDNGSNPLSSSRIYINEYSYDDLKDNYITKRGLQGDKGESLANKISIRDYQIQGSPLSGLSFVKSMIKEGDMPYEHVDDDIHFSDGHYYWDTSLTNPNEFYLLTNFNDYIGTNNSYVLEVKSDGYLYIKHNNVETAKIKKECIPYITLCSKWTESNGSSMKVYTPYIPNLGGFNEAVGSLILGAHAPNGSDDFVPMGTSIGIIGDGTYKDENNTTTINPKNIDLKLNTHLRAAKLQVCYGTKIEINPDYVIINGTYYNWTDNIFIDDDDVCDNFKQVSYGKLIHENSSNNEYFQLDKYQPIIKNDYYTSRSRNRFYMTDGLYDVGGIDQWGLFSGYTITLSGKDYQINDDDFSPYIFGTSSRSYQYITWKKSDANKIFFNGVEATVDTSIQLFKWINTIQGKNGTLPKFIPLYNNQLATQDEHNSKFGNNTNIAKTFYPTVNLSFSGSVDSTKLNTWNDDYCALLCGQRYNNKNAYSMAGVKIGFESKGENYGWTVLGMTENSELINSMNDSTPTYTYVAAIPLSEDNSKHKIIYGINNKSSYKRKLYFKFDSEEFTINVPPLSTKYIACPVSIDYEKATGVTWVLYPDDNVWQEEKYEYKIDVSDEPTILVSTSGPGLRFDIENSFADAVKYSYYNANGNQGSQQMSPLSPGSFYTNNYVWVNEELLKNSYISYNNPNTKKEVKILIGDITKKYQRPINFYVVHDVSMSYIVVDNQTDQSTNLYLKYGSNNDSDYSNIAPGINLLTIGGPNPSGYYVYYYHPDNIEWQTKYYNSMPVRTLTYDKTVKKSQEQWPKDLMSSADIRVYDFETNIAVEAFDKTNATYEHIEGRRADSTTIEISEKNGKYVVKSTLEWYTGGDTKSKFKINFTCDRYKVDVNSGSSGGNTSDGENSNPSGGGSTNPGGSLPGSGGFGDSGFTPVPQG